MARTILSNLSRAMSGRVASQEKTDVSQVLREEATARSRPGSFFHAHLRRVFFDVMRVLPAFDKFKDALSAAQVCHAAATALRVKPPDRMLDCCPLTDGGEGFCTILTTAAKGRLLAQIVRAREGARLRLTWD